MKTNVKMKCPNCSSTINVDELLISQFSDSIRKDLQAELSRKEAELNQERADFKLLSEQLSKEKTEIDDIVS